MSEKKDKKTMTPKERHIFSIAAAIVSCIREEKFSGGTKERMFDIADDLWQRAAEISQHYEETSS